MATEPRSLHLRLQTIAEQSPSLMPLLTVRHALRHLPRMASGSKFDFADNPPLHALSIWRAVWLAWYFAARRETGQAEEFDPAALRHASQQVDAAEKQTKALRTKQAVKAARHAIRTAEFFSRGSTSSAFSELSNALDPLTVDFAHLEHGDRLIDEPIAFPEGKPDLRDFENACTSAFAKADIVKDFKLILRGEAHEVLKEPLDKYDDLWCELGGQMPSTLTDNTFGQGNYGEGLFGGESKNSDSMFAPSEELVAETVSTKDYLEREPLADALAVWLRAPENSGHVAIGLFGDWGIGKSTFVNLVKPKIGIGHNSGSPAGAEAANQTDSVNNVKYLYGEFNAWQYEHTGNIQAGLAQEAVTALTSNMNWWNRLSLTWHFSFKEHKTRLLLTLALVIVPALVIYASEIFSYSSLLWYLPTIPFIYRNIKEIFSTQLAKELRTYLRLPDYGEHLGTIPVMRRQIKTLAELRLHTGKSKTQQRRLLFVIDDLDRCSHEGVVKTLEAVRLVMDLQNVVVVIAVDHRIALASLALHYQGLSEYQAADPKAIARDYLGKVIHIPITLNSPSNNSVAHFLKSNLWEPIDPVSTEPNAEKKAETPAGLDVQPTKEPAKATSADVADVKEHTRAVDAENTAENQIGLSQKQQDLFIALAEMLEFTNPRQLKRLHNSYALIRRRYPEEDMKTDSPPHPRLVMLFYLEYLNDLSACARRKGMTWIKSGEETTKNALSEVPKRNEISELLGQRNVKNICHQVIFSVLPALEE